MPGRSHRNPRVWRLLSTSLLTGLDTSSSCVSSVNQAMRCLTNLCSGLSNRLSLCHLCLMTTPGALFEADLRFRALD